MSRQWGKMERDWVKTGRAEAVRPIIPTGHAYSRGRRDVKYIPPQEVSRFLKIANRFGGSNWWRWDYMDEDHWTAIKSAAISPPAYKPVRPTGPEWWVVTRAKQVVWTWTALFLFAVLWSRFRLGYRRWDECMLYAFISPMLLMYWLSCYLSEYIKLQTTANRYAER